MERIEKCNLTAVQLHGQEPPTLVEKLAKENLVVIKALFATKKPYLSDAYLYSAASFCLVEYGKGILPGGNAEAWDSGLSARLNTRIPLKDFNERFDASVPEEEEYDTLGGLFHKLTGRIPELNDTIRHEDFSFTIVKKSQRRIRLVKVRRSEKAPPEKSDSESSSNEELLEE